MKDAYIDLSLFLCFSLDTWFSGGCTPGPPMKSSSGEAKQTEHCFTKEPGVQRALPR